MPLSVRVWRYLRTVRRTGLYLAGSFIWSQAAARRIRTVDETLIRHSWQPKKLPTESWEQWRSRTVHVVRGLLLRLGAPTMVQEALRANHRWAGHVARMEDSMTRMCCRWKCASWWEGYSRIMARRDPYNDEGWRHDRPGRHARWDTDLHAAYGANWWSWAEDRKGWQTRETAYVTRRHGELLPPRAGRALPAPETAATATPPPTPSEIPRWSQW